MKCISCILPQAFLSPSLKKIDRKVVLGFANVYFLFDGGGLFGKLLIISGLSKFLSSLCIRAEVSSLVAHFWIFILKWQQFSTLNPVWCV